MGNHPNLTHNRYPRQSGNLGAKVDVCFHYDTSNKIPGTIVRDDREAPWISIIRLDEEVEGMPRFVQADECQYSTPRRHPAGEA